MAEVSRKFTDYIVEHGLKKRDAARALGVCPASFYNYLAKTDLPSVAVLRVAHRKWDLNFKYAEYDLDERFFEKIPAERGPVQEEQIPLPFLEALQTDDIEVLEVTAKKPNAVDVKLRIRFAG